MATDVRKILEENQPVGDFQPYSFVSKKADTLTFYFKSDADYSKRLTDHVTLFLSIDTNELVGCRIKGISGILEDLPNYVEISHGPVALSIVFLPFRGTAQDDETRKIFNELARAASDRHLTLEESSC